MPTTARISWWDRYPSWLIGIALVILVPPAYYALQQFSYSNWLINSGIFFAFVWFAPRRLWLWIILAFMIARLAPTQFNHLVFPERFPIDYGFLGWKWYVADVPGRPLGALGDPVLLLSGAIYLRARGITPDRVGTPSGMGHLHIAALISSIFASSKDVLYVIMIGDPLLPHTLNVLLGHFTGIMLAAPLAALLFVPAYRRGTRQMWREVAGVMLPASVIVLTLAQKAPDLDTAEILRRLLLIGVVLMAIRHGWRGAVLALFVLSAGIQVEAKLFNNLNMTIVVQAFVSVAGVMALLFGAARDASKEHSERLEKSLEHNEQLTANLASAALNAQQVEIQERNQVAMELHDEFGQNLTALQIYLHGMPKDTPNTGTMLSITDGMRSQIQRVLETLRPAALEELGLYTSVDSGSIRQTAEAGGIRMTTELRGDSQLLRQLDSMYQLTAYRVIQEAVTNIVRHAKASECCIRISVYERNSAIWLFIDVRDDGIGRVKNLTDGHALTNLRQRITSIGGTWRWHNLPQGLRLHVLLCQTINR